MKWTPREDHARFPSSHRLLLRRIPLLLALAITTAASLTASLYVLHLKASRPPRRTDLLADLSCRRPCSEVHRNSRRIISHLCSVRPAGEVLPMPFSIHSANWTACDLAMLVIVSPAQTTTPPKRPLFSATALQQPGMPHRQPAQWRRAGSKSSAHGELA